MKIELASLGTVLAALNESPGTVSAAVIFGGEYYDGKKNVFFNQLFALDPAAKVLYIQRERERESERERGREREKERETEGESERERARERERLVTGWALRAKVSLCLGLSGPLT